MEAATEWFLRTILKPGDLFLTWEDSLGSRLIRWMTGSPYSHAELYIGGGQAIGCVFPHVRRVDLGYYKYFHAYRLRGLAENQVSCMVEMATQLIGSRYDLLVLPLLAYRLLFNKLDVCTDDPSKNAYDCSEFVSTILQQVGIELPRAAVNMLPCNLLQLPCDYIVGYEKIADKA